MTATLETNSRGLISSSKIEGTAVYNVDGEKLGTVECLMIDRAQGSVAYAVMSFGGFLGLGEKRHPVPWQSMTFDTSKEGYVVSLSKDELKAAPNLDPGEYGQLGERDYEEMVFTHYKAEPYWL
jgi:sporulation protein YlmC with PRC-barrel domain